MSSREQILKLLKKKKMISSAEIVEFLGISRQAVARQLSRMVAEGLVIKSGSTRSSRYRLSNSSEKNEDKVKKWEFRRKLKGLEEDRVFEEISRKIDLESYVGKSVHSILYYAFTEMLNNSIDHSQSENCIISLEIKQNEVFFCIRDSGVGVFENIRKTFKLKETFHAIEHLLKGKQTTAPQEHTGQGIFFTSKIADKFTLRSQKVELIIDNDISDSFIRESRSIKGTEVTFKIKRRSRKSLENLFWSYANEDFDFDRTRIVVKLTADREHLSRSQAKRLLSGLDQFQLVVFDFSGVKMVGQAFADEIFRVYAQKHRQIKLEFIHAEKGVEAMIRRSIKKGFS